MSDFTKASVTSTSDRYHTVPISIFPNLGDLISTREVDLAIFDIMGAASPRATGSMIAVRSKY